MPHQLFYEKSPPRLLIALAACVSALGIFVVETSTPLEDSVAVFYSVVVLMAGRILRRQGVLLVSAACITLTVLSYLVLHGAAYGQVTAMAVSGVAAIGITTVLVLQNQSRAIELRKRAELLDVTHDAIFVRDMNNVITYWNEGARELYGWTSEEALGRISHELLQTVLPSPLEEITASALRTGRWEGELVHAKKDGSRVVVASRWSVRCDGPGRPAAILETNNDITDRKAAEERLREAENNLRTTLDSIPAMVVSSWPDGTVDFTNAYCRAQGFSQSNLPARIHPDDLPALTQNPSNLATGQPSQGEVRLRKANGEYRWYMARDVTLRDETGEILKRFWTAIDIDDRKRAEEALRQSDAHLAKAQRLSRTGSFSLELSTGNINWSDETFRIFGCDPSTKPTAEFLLERAHPEDRHLVRRYLEGASVDSNDWDFEHRLQMPDGSIKYLRVVAHAVSHDPGKQEFAGAVMDISDSKRAEERLQRVQAELAHVTRVATLGELTASIAHEVNQPLAAIVTNGEVGLRWLNQDVPDSNEVRAAVVDMVNGARRASEVIQRLRMLYKKIDLQKKPLDINNILDEARSLIQPALRSQNASLRLELASSLPRVCGDPIQLQQVVLNLVVNAMEAVAAVREGPREVVLRSRREDASLIAVDVQDSGRGIAPGDEARMFEAFFTTKTDGLGMGLSICRSIIENHGGTLGVSRNSDQGATFCFTVPLDEAHKL